MFSISNRKSMWTFMRVVAWITFVFVTSSCERVRVPYIATWYNKSVQAIIAVEWGRDRWIGMNCDDVFKGGFTSEWMDTYIPDSCQEPLLLPASDCCVFGNITLVTQISLNGWLGKYVIWVQDDELFDAYDPVIAFTSPYAGCSEKGCGTLRQVLYLSGRSVDSEKVLLVSQPTYAVTQKVRTAGYDTERTNF